MLLLENFCLIMGCTVNNGKKNHLEHFECPLRLFGNFQFQVLDRGPLTSGMTAWRRGIASPGQPRRAHNHSTDAFYYFCHEISECSHQAHGK